MSPPNGSVPPDYDLALRRLKAARGGRDRAAWPELSRAEVIVFLDQHRGDALMVLGVISAYHVARSLRLDDRAVRTWQGAHIDRRNRNGHVPSLKPYTPGK